MEGKKKWWGLIRGSWRNYWDEKHKGTKEQKHKGGIMIYLGADHGGFELKEKVKGWLDEWGEEYEDLGADELDAEDDYTDFAKMVAERVNQEDDRSREWGVRAKGILLCRSGGGMLIAANRYPKVHGVYVFDQESAVHARDNNDANVISLAGDWIGDEEAKNTIKTWLETPFSGEDRYQRRISQMETMGVES